MSSQAAAFAAFAVVAALLTVAPGVDTLLVLRTTVSAGRRTGLAAGAGVLTGLFGWACSAGLGVAAVLATSATAYTVLRVAGAVYLAGLGGWLLLRAVRGRDESAGAVPAPAVSLSLARAYSQGLFTNLLNPKVGAFYVTLLPQFIVAGQPVLLISLGLALVHVALGLLWFVVITWVASRLRVVLQRQRVRRVLDGLTGTILVGFAARLALSHRT